MIAIRNEISERIVEDMDINLVSGEMVYTIRKKIRSPAVLEYDYFYQTMHQSARLGG